MAEASTWHERVSLLDKEEFVATYEHLFLLGTQALNRPDGPMRTVSLDRAALQEAQRRAAGGERAPSGVRELPKVYAVVKVQDTFPSMISIGRTSNNDILIEDVQVSKFHACFRLRGDVLELEDMGSRNGTKLGGVLLVKGSPQPARRGDTIALGTLSFVLCDAGTLWDRLRKPGLALR